jgi:hypothetical protein
VPRMFLGATLDLLCAKPKKYPPCLFSPLSTLLLVGVLAAIAVASSRQWSAWYRPRVAAIQRAIVQESDLRLQHASGSIELSNLIDQALDATSLDQARHYVAQARSAAIQSADEKQHSYAHVMLDSAYRTLREHDEKGQTERKYWKDELWETLRSIPAYAPGRGYPHRVEYYQRAVFEAYRYLHLNKLRMPIKVKNASARIQDFRKTIDQQISDERFKQYILGVIKQAERPLTIHSDDEVIVTSSLYIGDSNLYHAALRRELGLSKDDKLPPPTEWYQHWLNTYSKALRDISKIDSSRARKRQSQAGLQERRWPLYASKKREPLCGSVTLQPCKILRKTNRNLADLFYLPLKPLHAKRSALRLIL